MNRNTDGFLLGRLRSRPILIENRLGVFQMSSISRKHKMFRGCPVCPVGTLFKKIVTLHTRDLCLQKDKKKEYSELFVAKLFTRSPACLFIFKKSLFIIYESKSLQSYLSKNSCDMPLTASDPYHIGFWETEILSRGVYDHVCRVFHYGCGSNI